MILSENYFSTQVVEVVTPDIVASGLLKSEQSSLVTISDAALALCPKTVDFEVQTHVFSFLQEVVAKATTAATNKIIFFILVKK